MSAPQLFVYRRRAGAFYAVVFLLLIFPALGIGSCVKDSVGPVATIAPAAALLVIAGIIRLANAIECRLEVTAAALRLSEAHLVFGSKRKETVVFELPLAELTEAKQINIKIPSSRGGWNHGSNVHLPGDRIVRADMLGPEYTRFTAWLRERLGDRFTVEERT